MGSEMCIRDRVNRQLLLSASGFDGNSLLTSPLLERVKTRLVVGMRPAVRQIDGRLFFALSKVFEKLWGF